MEEIDCGPIVNILGDELAQALWEKVLGVLILPYVNDTFIYDFDLSLIKRELTNNQILEDAVKAIKQYKVCVKCATKTALPPKAESEDDEYQSLSPTYYIRSTFGGIIIREADNIFKILPFTRHLKLPIDLVILANEDISNPVEISIKCAGTLELVFTPSDKNFEVIKETVFDFYGKGVAVGLTTSDEIIEDFAKESFEIALNKKKSLFFIIAKDVHPVYGGHYANIYQRLYDEMYRCKFLNCGISYEMLERNRAMQYMLTNKGGYILSMRYQDGDEISSILYTIYAMLSSYFLCHKEGIVIAENYYGPSSSFFNQQQEVPGFHSIDAIYAWVIALHNRAKLDGNKELENFAKLLKEAAISVIRAGFVTSMWEPYVALNTNEYHIVNSYEFLDHVSNYLMQLIEKGEKNNGE